MLLSIFNSKGPGRLLMRCSLFGLLLIFCFIGLFFGSGLLARRGRMGVSEIKHKRLEAIKKPKVVLIGGSNLHYGLDSPLLESLVDRPVVNMGIQGSIGIHFFFAEIEESVRAGDIVVAALEHAQFYAVEPWGETALYTVVSTRPKNLRYLAPRQWGMMFKKGWIAIADNLKAGEASLLRIVSGKKVFRDRSNEWGDHLGHKGKKSIFSPSQPEAFPGFSDESIEMVKRWIKTLENKGVCVQLAFAPIARSALPSGFSIENESVKSLPWVGDWQKLVLPDDTFFDTAHHLLFEKREERTRLLGQDLTSSDCFKKSEAIQNF